MKNLLFALLAALSAGLASATDYRWASAQNGDFGTAANWSPSTGVPGGSDKAIFDVDGAYIVTETEATRTIGSVNVTNADVTVSLGGNAWTVNGPWSTYNRTADAATTFTTISGGTLDVQDGSASDSSGIIVSLKNSNITKGNLRITGANTRVTTGALWMGGASGSFTLDSGAACDVAGDVHWGGIGAGGSDNTVTITGAGTTFRQTAAGSNTGNIIGDSNKVYFADSASAYFTSTYYLSGTYGGRWNELWITNGASVVFGDGLVVSYNQNGDKRTITSNVCTIAGADTQVIVTNSLWVSQSATSNSLHITDRAVVMQRGEVEDSVTIGRNGDALDRACGNEFRVDEGAEYHCVRGIRSVSTYLNLYLGSGEYSHGNRIFVGAGSTFEIARPNGNLTAVGYNGGHDNGIIVSNGTFNISTMSWHLKFGTSANDSTPCGSGNYVEFYGDHPLVYMGTLTFNTGSKLIYHIDADGYAVAPMNFRCTATNTSAAPARLVLDVANWQPKCKTTIPLAVTMRDADIDNNKALLDELIANVELKGTKHQDYYTLSLSPDNKTLLLTCTPKGFGFLLILR